MSSWMRGPVAVLALAALLVGTALPAGASALKSSRSVDERAVPVVMDVLFLRPIGLVMTITGAALYGVAAPFVAITRPTELGKPLQPLVIKPARYTFVDPLGEH